MIRKQIYIERRHENLLKRLARQLGCSEAELIRQALDRSLGSVRMLPDLKAHLEAWEREKAFIRRLIAQDPLAGRRRWTRDELYEDEA